MEKQNTFLIFSMVILIVFINLTFVSALDTPSQTRTINGGCEILTPDFTVLKQNADFTFYFHVYNLTAFVNNDSANCTFHLYSTYDNGKHIFRINDVPFLPPRDFFVYINGTTNLSQIGRYSYLFECGIPVEHIKTGQSNACGIEGEFEVTVTGQELTITKSTMYIFIFIIFFILLIGFLIGGIYLPSNNQSDELTGYILAVSNLKYAKVFLLAFAFLTAVILSYFSYQLSLAYLDMDFLSNIFLFLFYFSLALIIVGFPLMIYFLIANWIKDNKISELLSRGLSVKGE
jgi:hypothetical protein